MAKEQEAPNIAQRITDVWVEYVANPHRGNNLQRLELVVAELVAAVAELDAQRK